MNERTAPGLSAPREGPSVACRPFLIALLVVLGPVAAIPTHAEPVFSFWRNLSIGGQTYVQLDFRNEAAPLSRELAESCCAVRPGQAVSLVRRGRVVGTGLVGDITAAAVPRAGDDRMVFFDVEGFADSLGMGHGPPGGGDPTGRDYDLFVVGDVMVRELAAEPRSWDPGEGLPAIVERALAAHVLEPYSFAGRATDRSEPESPESLAVAFEEDCELIEYMVPMGERGAVTVQTTQRRSKRYGPFFVRVVGEGLAEPALIRGELDFFLEVDGIPYMVLRDRKPGTGAWCYVVYRLSGEEPPEKVICDGTWAT